MTVPDPAPSSSATQSGVRDNLAHYVTAKAQELAKKEVVDALDEQMKNIKLNDDVKGDIMNFVVVQEPLITPAAIRKQ